MGLRSPRLHGGTPIVGSEITGLNQGKENGLRESELNLRDVKNKLDWILTVATAGNAKLY